jgi:hypothetical protein
MQPVNQAMQTLTLSDYPLNMNQAIAGEWVDNVSQNEWLEFVNSGRNTAPTATALTVGGAPAGTTFTINVSFTNNVGAVVTRTVTYVGPVGATIAQATEAISRAINANSEIYAQVAAGFTATTVTFTPRNLSSITAVTASVAGGTGTITAASTVTPAANATPILFGYAVGSYPGFTQSANILECSSVNTATNLTLLGVALHEYTANRYEYPFDPAIQDRGYPANSRVRVARRGRVWVPTSEEIAVGQAYVTPTAGQFCASTTPGAIVFPRASYNTLRNSQGLVVLELNNPVLA